MAGVKVCVNAPSVDNKVNCRFGSSSGSKSVLSSSSAKPTVTIVGTPGVTAIPAARTSALMTLSSVEPAGTGSAVSSTP